MSLTILNVAYAAAPVGVDAIGGAEQILGQLDQAIVAAGHRSLVVACAGSVVAGTLLSTGQPPRVLSPRTMQDLAGAHRATIERALAECPVDVVHLHGIDCSSYLPRGDVPTLVTLHLPPDWYPPELFGPGDRPVHFNCVSEAQLRTCPPLTRQLGSVTNGVSLRRYHPSSNTGEYVLALGRICPEKGFHLALDAARRADLPLTLAGKTYGYVEHRTYFREEIVPRLDAERRFVGPATGRRKLSLLARARCLVVPSRAPETSSLVAMEALACGTPVVAFPAGALAEIVEDGRTGFLVGSVDEMASAMREVGRLDRRDCREAAEQRFDAAAMCDRYLHLYASLAETRARPIESPAATLAEVPS